ncbi:MAG: DUF1761 domain-containing protein [Patescibacteria group bacterium]
MDISVNYLAVFLSAVASLAVGSIWYSDSFLGQSWRKLVGITKGDYKKTMVSSNIKAFAMALLTAFILFHVTFLSNQHFNNDWLSSALSSAFMMWMGFIVPSHITHDAFEQRPFNLTAISLGHHLLEFLAMALVIGLIGK